MLYKGIGLCALCVSCLVSNVSRTHLASEVVKLWLYFDGFWMSWKIFKKKTSRLGISDRLLIMFGVAIASV